MFVIKTGERQRLVAMVAMVEMVAMVAMVTLVSLMAACGGRSVARREDDAGQDAVMVDVHLRFPCPAKAAAAGEIEQDLH